MYKLPERRGEGGEVIWAIPERKNLFYVTCSLIFKTIASSSTDDDNSRGALVVFAQRSEQLSHTAHSFAEKLFSQ